MRFRVWNIKEQAMYYPLPIRDDGYNGELLAIELSGEIFLRTEGDDVIYLTEREQKNYIIMLSTELYDLNNKEIFEGDVIQFNRGVIRNGLYIVCFGQCFAYPSDVDNYIGFFLRKVNENPNIHYTFYPDYYNRINCHIVGNIYQNKELLKGGAK
jgi:uncharacterized phage protein (TIGR01671 family)